MTPYCPVVVRYRQDKVLDLRDCSVKEFEESALVSTVADYFDKSFSHNVPVDTDEMTQLYNKCMPFIEQNYSVWGDDVLGDLCTDQWILGDGNMEKHVANLRKINFGPKCKMYINYNLGDDILM